MSCDKNIKSSALILSTFSLKESIRLGEEPGHVVVNPRNGKVYINDEDLSKIFVYRPNENKVSNEVALWPAPHEAVFYFKHSN